MRAGWRVWIGRISLHGIPGVLLGSALSLLPRAPLIGSLGAGIAALLLGTTIWLERESGIGLPNLGRALLAGGFAGPFSLVLVGLDTLRGCLRPPQVSHLLPWWSSLLIGLGAALISVVLSTLSPGKSAREIRGEIRDEIERYFKPRWR